MEAKTKRIKEPETVGLTDNHKPFYENHNKAILEENNAKLPLIYFNRVVLAEGESYAQKLRAHESVLVVIAGSLDVTVGGQSYKDIGVRRDVFSGYPEAVYLPRGMQVNVRAKSLRVEFFIAGGKIDKQYAPFALREKDIEKVQYGSDDTKTHRKILHILGRNASGRVGRLLVSELFTVGEGGWSGFPPHKHDQDRKTASGIAETLHEELYYFRFNPSKGFAAQFLYTLDQQGCETSEKLYKVKDGSTFLIDKGYHPVVVAPGYSMYYFTVLVGKSERSLIQYFEPKHSHQLETIPGIKDMISAFKKA